MTVIVAINNMSHTELSHVPGECHVCPVNIIYDIDRAYVAKKKGRCRFLEKCAKMCLALPGNILLLGPREKGNFFVHLSTKKDGNII